jgi:hypothetical protein
LADIYAKAPPLSRSTSSCWTSRNHDYVFSEASTGEAQRAYNGARWMRATTLKPDAAYLEVQAADGLFAQRSLKTARSSTATTRVVTF